MEAASTRKGVCGLVGGWARGWVPRSSVYRVWYDVYDAVLVYDMAWYRTGGEPVPFDSICRDNIRRCGVVLDMVWCGVVWCGVM